MACSCHGENISEKKYQAFELQWTLGFYIYAAERRPDATDFSTNGTVWTVIKHGGYFKRKDANGARYFHHGIDGNSESSYFFVDRLKFSIKDESGLMTINKIYPESTTRQGSEDAIQRECPSSSRFPFEPLNPPSRFN
jgi:hypothetical protein